MIWVYGYADVGLVHQKAILHLLTRHHDKLLHILIVPDLLQYLNQNILLSSGAGVDDAQVIHSIPLLRMQILQLLRNLISLFFIAGNGVQCGIQLLLLL